MNYEEFVIDSIEFFESAKKRHQDKLEQPLKPRAKLQLEKEIHMFNSYIGYWRQEQNRINLTKKYQKN